MALMMCRGCEIYFAWDEAVGPGIVTCPRCGKSTRSATTVPEDELQNVTLSLSDALECAASGKQAAGYALLMRGLARAERSLIDGRPWGTELLRCWRAAIDRYCERVGDFEEAAEESASALWELLGEHDAADHGAPRRGR